jgi:ATP-binding cassette subfamily B protein
MQGQMGGVRSRMTVEGSQQRDPDQDPQEEEGPGRSTLTYQDWLKPREGRSLRRLAGLVRSSIRLTYEAAPRLFVLTTALDVLSGLGVGAQLLIGKEALQILLAGRSTSHFPQAIPYLVALFVITVLLALASSTEAEQGKVLGEQVTRLAYDRIFGVSERIELAAFESPQFFDRLQRAIIPPGLPK